MTKPRNTPFRKLIPRLTYDGIKVGDNISFDRDPLQYKVTKIISVKLLTTNNLEIIGMCKEVQENA